MRDYKAELEKWFAAHCDYEIYVEEDLASLSWKLTLVKGTDYAKFAVDFSIFDTSESIENMFQMYLDKAKEVFAPERIQGWDKQAWEWHGEEEVYPSFWKTVVTSKQWEEWEGEVNKRLHRGKFEKAFDVGESRECGWLSPNHFQAFLDFTNKKR